MPGVLHLAASSVFGCSLPSLRGHPSSAKAHNNLALALVDLGRLNDALGHFRKSVEIDPKPEIYSDLGATLARLGQRSDARAAYQRALELDPNNTSANFNMAVLLTQSGALGDAEEHYRRAVRGKANAEAYNGLGYVLARQDRTEDAIAAFRKAIAINPKFTAAHQNLAEALTKAGKAEEAAAERGKVDALSVK